jgi:hypothetical protein
MILRINLWQFTSKIAPAVVARSASTVARAALIQVEDLTRLKTAAVGLNDLRCIRLRSGEKVRNEKVPGLFYPSEIGLQPNGTFTLCGQSLPGLRDGAVQFEKAWPQTWRAGARTTSCLARRTRRRMQPCF